MSDHPLYRLRDMSKHYGGPFRLHIRQLEVQAGEVVGLLGPVGAGKSTLLRLLAGLEPPSGGEAWFGGDRLDGPGLPLSVRRRVTLAFQHPRLLTGTVRSNVEYGLRLRGKGWRPSAVDGLLDRLGLAGIASQSSRSLSGGQAQLVALARALAIEPEVLLVDEPTAHLDPALVALVEGVITERNRVQGTTVVWATHNLFQARRVAHRVGLLLDGDLIEVAPTRMFFEAPCDPRSAAFVRGEMVY
jgi:tungstate transport system ATP-binding protein